MHESAFRQLKNTHQRLYRDWKRADRPCIICAERPANEKDHLPPKVLLPKSSRNHGTEFFTFPVCSQCNRSSSDEDVLLSFLLAIGLNQDSIRADIPPSDPDLSALYDQMQGHLTDPKTGQHRLEILRSALNGDLDGIDKKGLYTPNTLTKIVKSIYWLNTGGDVLQRYNPGWWIASGVDTSKTQFIEKHLKVTHAEVHWDSRFITRFNYGLPENDVGGFIMCSLHFYTKQMTGEGMSWLLIALPRELIVDGVNVYEMFSSAWGKPTIPPTDIPPQTTQRN